jgi:hypothetical protein
MFLTSIKLTTIFAEKVAVGFEIFHTADEELKKVWLCLATLSNGFQVEKKWLSFRGEGTMCILLFNWVCSVAKYFFSGMMTKLINE